MLDPRPLRMLQEIAATGSFSAAARSLGYTQPAVSYQMRNLERAVGAALTVRVGRFNRLTPVGETLLAHAGHILSAIRAAEQDVARLVDAGAGRVRLAAFPSSCAKPVPMAMEAMRREHPAIDVQLIQAEPEEARLLVRRGEADLAVCYRYAASAHNHPAERQEGTRLARIPLLDDEVRLLLPADDALAGRQVIQVGDLADATWIIGSTNFEEILRRSAASAGFAPRITTIADDYVAMQALVAHRLGVAILPRLALAAHRDHRVVARRLDGWPARRVQVELWEDMLRVDAVTAMVGALRAAVAELGTGPMDEPVPEFDGHF